MAIVQYKLIYYPTVGGMIPISIKSGGYWPENDTLIGWSDTILDSEIYSAQIKVLSKSEFLERQLRIHSLTPFKNITNQETLEGVDMTELEVIDTFSQWFDNFVQENFVASSSIETLKTDVLNRAFLALERKIETASVNVFISSINTNCPFGCDKTTQDNIIGINVAISRGVNVPNPTYWTPKGYTDPVTITHTELAEIGGAIFNKKNEMYGIYFAHKSSIISSSDPLYVAQYDYTEGY